MGKIVVDLFELLSEIGLQGLSCLLKVAHFLLGLEDVVFDVLDFFCDLVNNFNFLLNAGEHFLELRRKVRVKHLANFSLVHFQFLQLTHSQVFNLRLRCVMGKFIFKFDEFKFNLLPFGEIKFKDLILLVIGKNFVLDLFFELLKFSRGEIVIVFDMGRHFECVFLELKVFFVHSLDFVVHPELVLIKVINDAVVLFFLFGDHFFVLRTLSFESEDLLIKRSDLFFGVQHDFKIFVFLRIREEIRVLRC